MTPEEKQCVLDQARANVARLSEMEDREFVHREQTQARSDPRDFSSHDPVRRSWPDGVPPPEPRPPRPGLDTSPAAPAVDWAAYIEERIASEREFVFAIIAESQASLGEAIDQLGKAIVDVREQKAHKELANLNEMKAQAARLEVAMEKLRGILELHSNKVVDLTTLPARRSEVN